MSTDKAPITLNRVEVMFANQCEEIKYLLDSFMLVEIFHTSQGVNEEAFVGKDEQAALGDKGDPGGRIWVNTLSSSNLKGRTKTTLLG